MPNTACTDFGPSTTTVVLVFVPLASPLQFKNVQPAAGAAVRFAETTPLVALTCDVTVTLPPGAVTPRLFTVVAWADCEKSSE